MKYSFNNIMEPWYPEEYKIITMDPILQNTYAVSNYGNIININTNNILKKFRGSGGYLSVLLTNADKSRSMYPIHILVATYFIPRTEDDILNDRILVNHKNLLTSVNYAHNLEWVNTAENAAHSHQYRHLKIECPVTRMTKGPWCDTRGSKNGMSKLTENQVHLICKMLEQNYSYNQICNELGLENTENNHHLISNIVRKKRWTYISKDYNLPKPQKCTNFSEYVIPVCELLEKNLTNREIVANLNIKNDVDTFYRFINRIRNRKVYNQITKNYIF